MKIIEDIKAQFIRGNNTVAQFIILNVIFWVAYEIANVFATLFNIGIFKLIFDFIFVLPSNLDALLLKPFTIITYAFQHGGIWHIASNMIGLWIFGRIVKDNYGANRVIGLYFVGALGGAFIYLLAYNTLPYYSNNTGLLIGASASVIAILVASATWMPEYKIHLMFLPPIKLYYIAAFYIILSMIQSTGRNSGGEMAHLGGALAGFVYAKMYTQGTDLGKPFFQLIVFFQNLFKKTSDLKVSHKRSNGGFTPRGATANNNVSQAEIDAILDKINQSGYGSLTTEEKQKLFSSSQK